MDDPGSPGDRHVTVSHLDHPDEVDRGAHGVDNYHLLHWIICFW